MSRYIIPGTDRPIYVLTQDQDEFDSDIDALEDILDKTEEQIHITRAHLAYIRDHKDEIIHNTTGATQQT